MSILVIEHSAISRANRLGTALTRYGHRLDTRRMHLGDPLPESMDGYDGLIIMGSPDRINDASVAYVAPEQALACDAHDRNLAVLGICFGAQVLATAFGGSVGVLEDGVRIGVHRVTQTTAGHDDAVLSGLPWTMDCYHWNRDVATSLPEDAVLLATGPAGDTQIWRLGVRTYAMQFHPEMSPATIDTIIADDRPDLDEAKRRGADVHDEVAEAWPTYERLTDRLMSNIALLLMPLDQRMLDSVRELRH